MKRFYKFIQLLVFSCQLRCPTGSCQFLENMKTSDYKELQVWHKAIDLVVEIYKISKLLSKEETYGISDQIRRSAVSIPSNIAEGQSRNSIKEFIQFLSIARGSLAELETQLLICIKVNMLSEDNIAEAQNITTEVGKMIKGLMNKLNSQLTTNN